MSISENGHDSSGLVIDDVTGVLVGFRLPSALSAWSLEENGNLTRGAQLFLHL